MNCAFRYRQVLQKIEEKMLACGRHPQEIKLVAVSKTAHLCQVQAVYQAGGHLFGENRLQDALKKIPLLSEDIEWHFIGTLQRNKVAKVISSFQLIHSVDHPLLAEKISQESQIKNLTTPILLQVNTSGEMTKHGLSSVEWEKFLDRVNQLPNLCIKGLMTMAPLTTDQTSIRFCFRKLFQLREKWYARMKDPNVFRELSMGMSNDYLIAVEEGATLLRIGSAIFEDI